MSVSQRIDLRLEDAIRAQFFLPPGPLTLTDIHLAENRTLGLRIAGETDPSYVVRVYRYGRHERTRVESELRWLHALADSGVRTAGPVPAISGGHTGALANGEGAPVYFAVLAHLARDESEPDLLETFRQLGTAAAQIQNHARTWPGARAMDRPVWDLETTMGPSTSWGYWHHAQLPTRLLELFLAARDAIGAQLPDIDQRTAVLQHADLKPANSIWRNGELYVIDFDDSGYSWPLFDLAASLSGLENTPLTQTYVEAWLTGYCRIAAVTPTDFAMIPALLMQRRIMLAGWLLAHPESHPDVPRDAMLADTADMIRKFLDGHLVTADSRHFERSATHD